MCLSLPAFNKPSCPLTGDAGYLFLPFHTLANGAVVTPYNSSGILGLDNMHLMCTILDAISADIKSLSKDWQ